MNEYKQLISKKWTERAPTFDEDHATENLNSWRLTLEELIGKKGDGSVLDVGTGTGFLANMIAELGYQSTGIDFAEGMLELGRENAKKRGTAVDFVIGDGEQLPFADNSFDVVVNSRVLWLLLDPVKAIAEWKRVLKPGGVLLSFIRIISPEDIERMKRESRQNGPKNGVCCPPEIEAAMPLRDAPLDRHLIAYQDAGFYAPEAILLRRNLSDQPELQPWFALKGVKV